METGEEFIEGAEGALEGAEEAATTVGGRIASFAPFALLGFCYMTNDTFTGFVKTVFRDFMWPGAVIVAKCCNASPI